MKRFLYFKETLPIYENILKQNIIYRKGWMVYETLSVAMFHIPRMY